MVTSGDDRLLVGLRCNARRRQARSHMDRLVCMSRMSQVEFVRPIGSGIFEILMAMVHLLLVFAMTLRAAVCTAPIIWAWALSRIWFVYNVWIIALCWASIHTWATATSTFLSLGLTILTDIATLMTREGVAVLASAIHFVSAVIWTLACSSVSICAYVATAPARILFRHAGCGTRDAAPTAPTAPLVPTACHPAFHHGQKPPPPPAEAEPRERRHPGHRHT
mmetsp:Transcript_34276/g.90536  ORF Transcript_34276/g.90536 Transcript_34276/m.90536 type:complete len:222 (-) Transcript_34276:18-683(-)